MTTDPWSLLDAARTVLVVHAHPDDESLSTGPLLVSLAARGARVVLATATRGEAGEVVAEAIAADDPRSLEEIRATEIDRATAALGIAERHMLGTAPALAAGAAPRTYRDSGMRWVREGLAGPAETAGPDSFTHRPREHAVADLAALIEHVAPDVVIGYDDAGTYGHPDHVHAHHVTAAACARTAVPFLEVASEPDAPGFTWRELSGTGATVRRALDSYRTQLTVLGHGDAGIAIRHVGGQEGTVPLRTGLRLTG